MKAMRLVIFFAVLFCVGCQENNFSDAALEEFFVLDRSLANSNDVIQHNIKNSFRQMSELANERMQFIPLVEKTNEAHRITKEFHDYINDIRKLLVLESGGFYNAAEAEKQGRPEIEGRPIGTRNTDVPHHIFLMGVDGNKKKEPQGAVIQEKILKLRSTYLQLVESLWENGGIKGSVFGDLSKKTAVMEELKSELAMIGIDSYNPKVFKNKTWAEFTFENMSVAAVYPVLRKLQNDASLLEFALVNLLINQQQSGCNFGANKIELIALSPKTKVSLGDTYEAEIVFGQYVSTATFLVSIDNQIIESKNGKATYKTKPTSTGEKKYTAKIKLTNPITGETQTFTKDFHYEVHQPFVNISSDKMNLFYIGIDNPITIAAVGIAPSNMTASIAGGTLTRKSNSSYIVNVNNPGNVTITVKDNKNGQTFPLEFRAKKLPDPVVRLGQKTDGLMGSGEFKAQPGLTASLENIDIDSRCIIESYTLYHTPKGEGINEIPGEGNRFKGKVADAIALAKPGDQYAFVDIKAKCPGDAIGRRVNCLVFKIK